MQILSISSILGSGIACSSSSTFLSESADCQGVNSEGVNRPVIASEDIQGILGKRSRDRKGANACSSSKKLKANCRPIKVLPHCWVIVGRLQLCNRNLHFWNGLYVPADCVALTDSTATICCCICEGPDPRLLGKIVKVNSWSFIPEREIAVQIKSTVSVESLKTTGLAHALSLQAILTSPRAAGDPSGPPLLSAGNSDCQLGILEIHSLELVEEQLSELRKFPSLFVSPAAADNPEVLQSHLAQQKTKKRVWSLCGFPRSISPPFVLPCKYSEDVSVSQSRVVSVLDRDDHSNGKPMLGFFVEIECCSSCSPSYFKFWNKAANRIMRRPEEVDGKAELSALCKQFPAVGLNTGQGSIFENSSFPPRPPMAALTIASNKRIEPERSLSYVYFSGSVAAWRPVLSGALGRCVIITGLRKRLFLVESDKKPHLIFFATQKCFVTLKSPRERLGARLKISPVQMSGAGNLESAYHSTEPNLGLDRTTTRRGKVRIDVGVCLEKNLESGSEFRSTCGQSDDVELGKEISVGSDQEAHFCMGEGKGEPRDKRIISFVGIVTDSLFQGTLIKLDERVWLLLTHQRHTRLHGLRIGAMLSLRSVHAVTVKDITGKYLLLGACVYSHVSVVLFSPLISQSLMQVHSKSLLLKYIQHLSFTSAFWLLSLIGSFRQKFRDIYSNKELLGTKKDAGIIQKYVQRVMAPDVTLERDVLKEFFHHQFCQLGNKLQSPIMQVPPISNFFEHVEALCQNPQLLRSCKTGTSVGGQSSSLRSSTNGQLTRLTISSQDLGIILLGSLQVCHTSGKLHLLDATGIVDVIIPDLSSSEHLYRTYQVSRFTVVLEGLCLGSPPASKGVGASSISWSSLLKEVETKRSSKPVKCCVRFFIRDATHLHDLDWCDNVNHPVDIAVNLNGSTCWQKQMQERWAKIKSHLDYLRVRFQWQAVEVPVCSDPQMGILCESIGVLARSNCLFKVGCKVVAVKLLVFKWPGGPAVSNVAITETSSWAPNHRPTTYWKSAVGIPVTLACLVVDDGSGPADCWALGDAAVSLLGLEKVTDPVKLLGATLDRMCTNFAIVQSSTRLSLGQILCHMTQRYGQIVLQNDSASGYSTASHYQMHRDGGISLNDDEQALMHLVVASACHNGPLVIVGGNIPSMAEVCSADCKKGIGPCKVLACSSPGYQSALLGYPKAQLFAHRVDPGLCLTDLETMTEQVARLL